MRIERRKHVLHLSTAFTTGPPAPTSIRYSEDEKNWIIRNLPSFIFEGPKFYAYPPCTPILSASEEVFGYQEGQEPSR